MIKVQVQKLYEKPNSLESLPSTLLNTIGKAMKEQLDERYKGLKCDKCTKDSIVIVKPDIRGRKHFEFNTKFCCPEFEDYVAKNYKVSFEFKGE